ncbi:MAG: MCE family protein [Planctomycetes bacterium]|nr:MCE family protein [Planctomycetota bacterium]
MSAQTRYFKLGAFVLAGIAVAVGAVILLGAGKLMRKRIMAETYVDESVQGLDVGAPVKFRGVHVGQLEKIEFAGVRYSQTDSRIVLTIAFWPEHLHGYGGDDPVGTLNSMVEKGLRIRMASAGLTGGTYLELDNFKPQDFPPPAISWTPQFSYLPSVPSTNTRMMTRVENVLEHVEKLRVDVISDKIVVLV